MTLEHLDVVIVGAGLSGICAAYYLQTRCPARRYALLEARDALGGTWDLFRYPGVRSDSDMHTLGFSFRPWREPTTIADGAAILRYLRETAAAYGIDHQIRYGQRVRRASWSSDTALWTLDVEHVPTGAVMQRTCAFLLVCGGYYDYSAGHMPEWPGLEQYQGRLIHPQQWPAGFDYSGKRVTVIGSGATAVTLAPALAERAAHVTIVQRSPSYVVAAPAQDRDARWLHEHLPAGLGYPLARWRSIVLGWLFYRLARQRPQATRQEMLQAVRHELGPEYDIETHFAPRYDPWDERLCVARDGDLFAAIRAGRVSVVTEQIAAFTEHGIRLASGQELVAEVVVAATGLRIMLLGGIELVVDGNTVDLATTLIYKGMMYSDVPNLASVFGYINMSWTLKCELIAGCVCRLLNYMQRHGYDVCLPRPAADVRAVAPLLELRSGYVRRAEYRMPRQGARDPWRMHQNYWRDLLNLRFGRLDDGVMAFGRGGFRR
jgi:cation diffusion facilitator CzcD-associated flavoprotein CzcO